MPNTGSWCPTPPFMRGTVVDETVPPVMTEGAEVVGHAVTLSW